ncbi:MAG: hypothetical protein AAF446_01685 [Pseudomonadota bacterium]
MTKAQQAIACSVLLLMLVGCATPVPDCAGQIESATNQGRLGQALSADVPAACSAEAELAWQTALSEFCSPQTGFDTAYRGQPQATSCRQNAYMNAYSHGRMLFELQTEQAELEQRIAELSRIPDGNTAKQQRELTRLRNRLITIQRDLPEWLTLARLEGFLAPAAVPDQPATTDSQ